MNLEKSILNAFDLTQRLEAALKIDDMDLCKELLVIRGEAMEAFQSWHQVSEQAEKDHCRPLFDDLVAADRSLQTQFKAALDVSANDMRQSLGSGSATPNGAYNPNPTPACVDRKA